MNTQLINSLITLIQGLTEEERITLEEKLFFASTELTTNDLMNLNNKSHSFDFLYDEPNIYTLDDGEQI